MAIRFVEYDRSFILETKNSSYVIKVTKHDFLAHIYYGKKIRNYDCEESLVFPKEPPLCARITPEDEVYCLDTLPQEYPTSGRGDYRHPALVIDNTDGSRIVELKYKDFNIVKGKPTLAGLPSLYSEDENDVSTLEIRLEDALTNIEVSLFYSIFENIDAITRWSIVRNAGNETVNINCAMSFSIDFSSCDYDFMHLRGFWARERFVERFPLNKLSTQIDSTRGASGHHHNPFFAILSKNADEENGFVYGFNLVYSGNFIGRAGVDQFDNTRVSMGINPNDFSWELKTQTSFATPEAVMVFSSNGIGGMSRTFHELYSKHLIRGKFKSKERPILINNWEATYFDFNRHKIDDLTQKASNLGVELFVLDDGWFGERNTDKKSLGDWFENKEKLPGGLKSLSEDVHKKGMQFGLWFEPEMISPDSELYRKQPDWCLHVEGRSRSESRYQLVLDLSRKDVREYLINCIQEIFDNVDIDYVKWDMNRNMSEVGSKLLPASKQKEIPHRYILGLYEIMDNLTTNNPHILFESCSSGGGRFDPGMLYYMPQTWTSDNTDAVDRLKIQYGTSLVYPLSTIGSHVSAVPNHQVNRITPLEMRGHVSMSGNMGYELDVTNISNDETEQMKAQIAIYKEIRPLVQFGEFYRILSPFEGNETSWMFVSKDKTSAVVFWFRVLAQPNPPAKILKLKALNPEWDYRIIEKDKVLGGDMLMNSGLTISVEKGDFRSIMYRLVKN